MFDDELNLSVPSGQLWVKQSKSRGDITEIISVHPPTNLALFYIGYSEPYNVHLERTLNIYSKHKTLIQFFSPNSPS